MLLSFSRLDERLSSVASEKIDAGRPLVRNGWKAVTSRPSACGQIPPFCERELRDPVSEDGDISETKESVEQGFDVQLKRRNLLSRRPRPLSSHPK